MNYVIMWISIVMPFFFACCGYSLAQRRNRTPWLWFLNCLLSGFIGLIVLACSPTLEYDEEIDFKENETLGWIILILCIILFILSVWYGYEAAKDYHARMFWQLHNTIMNR